MTNKRAREHIAELYNRVQKFKVDELSLVLNPDLFEAYKAIPELSSFTDDLNKLLNDFNDKLIKFADDKYPLEISANIINATNRFSSNEKAMSAGEIRTLIEDLDKD